MQPSPEKKKKKKKKTSSSPHKKTEKQTKMVDVSDANIAQAYADVRNDSNPTTWLVLHYVSNGKVGLQSTGTGNYQEFVREFDDKKAQFGYFRVTTGDSESKRAKFLFVSWVGTNVGSLAKAKVSVHKAKIKEVIREYAAEVHAEEREELNEDTVTDKIVKSGGANYGSGKRD